MPRRFLELDSLRGIAAITVVIHHLLLALPAFNDPVERSQSTALWPLIFTPLHIAWAGGEAVIFFFVLSGFVLSLPFYQRSVPYAGFLIKRVCRIYIPYAIAVAAALACASTLSRHGIPELSSEFNRIWVTPITLSLVVQHFSLIASFPSRAIDPVVWSLVYEMRISIGFPILMFFVMRYSWRTNLVGCLVLVGIAHVGATFVTGDYFTTLEYVPMFVAGALLARHRESLVARYRALSGKAKLSLVAGALLAYTYAWWLFPGVRAIHLSQLNDWITTVGAAIFLIVAIASDSVGAALRKPLVLLFGKASYSIYLLHSIVFLSLVYLLYPTVPIWLLWPITLITALGVALVSYRVVEVPANNLGHWLAARLSKGKVVKADSPSARRAA